MAISSKISKSIGIFNRLRHCVPHKVLLDLYYALVYPYFLYGNIVWGGTNVQHLRPLQLLQKKIIRLITNSSYLAHTSPLFKQTNVLKLTDLHNYLLCLHMFTLKQNNNAIFECVHNHYTRHREDARSAFQRLSVAQKSLSCAAPQAWNAVPRGIRECDSYNVFKREVKDYFINAY